MYLRVFRSNLIKLVWFVKGELFLVGYLSSILVASVLFGPSFHLTTALSNSHRYLTVLVIVLPALIFLFGGWFKKLNGVLVLLISLILAVVRVVVDRSTPVTELSSPRAGEQIRYVITSYPVRGNRSQEYFANVIDEDGGHAVKIRVEDSRYPERDVGDQCVGVGTLREGDGKSDFIERVSFRLRVGEVRCESGDLGSYGMLALRIGSRLRRWVEDVVVQGMIEPGGSLILGIIFGDDRPFERSFYDAVQRSGTTHIIAASGYNVSIVAGIVDPFGSLISKRSRLTVGSILVVCYLIIAGGSASLIRAVVMYLVRVLAQLFNRPCSATRALLVSLLLAALVEPRLVLSVGLQLSVLATLSIIYLSPSIDAFFTQTMSMLIRVGRRQVGGGVSGENGLLPVPDDLSSSVACFIGTAPLIGQYFGQVYLLSVLINVVALFILESSMLIGLAAVLLSRVDLVGELLLSIVSYQLALFVMLVEGSYKLVAGSVLNFPTESLSLTIILYLAIALFTLLYNPANKVDLMRY